MEVPDDIKNSFSNWFKDIWLLAIRKIQRIHPIVKKYSKLQSWYLSFKASQEAYIVVIFLLSEFDTYQDF